MKVIDTLGGFGSSVFLVPMASDFFDFHSVLGITSLLPIFSNLSKIYLFRKDFDWLIFLKIGVPSFVFVMLGAYFSQFLTNIYASLILGIFLILFSSFLLITPTYSFEPNNQNSIIGGGLAG